MNAALEALAVALYESRVRSTSCIGPSLVTAPAYPLALSVVGSLHAFTSMPAYLDLEPAARREWRQAAREMLAEQEANP